jgi:CxxC motif-containing protein (DUF1111 family)
MNLVKLPFLMAAALMPVAAMALDDDHLKVIPRTEAESARVAGITAAPSDFSKAEPFEAKSGGAATVRAMGTADAFSQLSANMAFDEQMAFKLGNALFRKSWIAAPASTKASDGLGPFSNARACQDCHLKDGRGHVPDAGEAAVGMFLRLSVAGGVAPAGIADYLPTLPHPVLGGQLQNFAAPGLTSEGRMGLSYRDLPVTLGDGEVVVLRAPTYSVEAEGVGEVMISPRLAPQMIGLGLLEAVPAADILARVDEADTDGDGISGRANIVWSEEFQLPMLGRFGWKAGMPTIREQTAGAFSGDMGLSTVVMPDPYGDCTVAQTECRGAAVGQEPGVRDGLEVDRAAFDLVAYYSRNLAVPERRNVDDPVVLQGKALFHDMTCASCHTPKFVTHRLEGQPEQSFQLIWPYTDMLLHDMGEGLADGRPEARATGSEWRTAPLWGIGLTAQVSGRVELLHDGRACSLTEAILWHGGEALPARDAFANSPKPDRDALIAFLESL